MSIEIKRGDRVRFVTHNSRLSGVIGTVTSVRKQRYNGDQYFAVQPDDRLPGYGSKRVHTCTREVEVIS